MSEHSGIFDKPTELDTLRRQLADLQRENEGLRQLAERAVTDWSGRLAASQQALRDGPPVESQLDALAKSSEEETGTPDAPEVTDWSKAVIGKFYHPPRPASDGWVSVASGQLPEIGVEVLVWDGDVQIDVLVHLGPKSGQPNWECGHNGVTHWRPLPAPPQEAK